MNFSRRYLALDLRLNELRAVCLSGREERPVLEDARIVALPEGTLCAALREPNVRDRTRLVESIRDLLHPLAGREERLAVVLPETAGRLLLVDVETPFKSRAEGEQVLKWQLKGSLPDDPGATALDFQMLDQREDGRVRLLVAVMARRVLEQYEEVVAEAGYHAVKVGFHSLFLNNFYRTRIERPEESVLVAVESGLVSLQYSQGRVPIYHRFREIGEAPTSIFQEVSRALVGAQEQHPGLRRAEVFVHCDWSDPEPLLDVLRAAFQREVVLLDPHIDRIAAVPSGLPSWRLRGLAAAVGAAEQMM